MGINGGELLVIALLALLVIGPERLPHYAGQLGRLVREARRMAIGARDQVKAELGPEFDDVDWQKLDPRQYDPRRIVKDALTEVWDDDPEPAGSRRGTGAARGTHRDAPDMVKPAGRAGARAGGGASRPGDTVGPAPFDSEAT
jgi:sec-independent protein translocase protein TatB